MDIARRIQQLRRESGLSQEELAEIAGVSRQAVSKWESGQSLPEIDRIIVLSDCFGVTTDYIIKGTEQAVQQAEASGADAKVFVIVATVLNLIGLLVACAVWYERQMSMAIVIGVIFMALGCMVYGIGMLGARPDTKAHAARLFWQINIWLLAFLPLSFVYGILTGHGATPYPLMGGSAVSYGLFWLAYIGVCLAAVMSQVRRQGAKRPPTT